MTDAATTARTAAPASTQGDEPKIYMNSAATSWPKPESVYQAVNTAMRSVGCPGRGDAESGRQMQDCRERIADVLGVPDAMHLIFQPGCTYASNLAILGLDYEPGQTIVMSGLEHHAVSRPIRKICKKLGLNFEVVPYAPERPYDLDFLEDVLKRGNVRLVCSMMASNVTGDLMPVGPIIELAKRYGALSMIDAAQAAGVIPVDVEQLGPDMMTFAGHKGLLGPTGVGGLWVRDGIELDTLTEGGTGGDSGRHEMSRSCPAAFEVGTHNLPAIVGLAAGVRWVQGQGVDSIRRHELALARRLIEGLRALDGVTVYGSPDAAARTSAVSFNVAGRAPATVGHLLQDRYGIICRAGFHCAPLAHESIGSLGLGGTIRVSPGYRSTEAEVDAVIGAVGELIGAGTPSA